MEEKVQECDPYIGFLHPDKKEAESVEKDGNQSKIVPVRADRLVGRVAGRGGHGAVSLVRPVETVRRAVTAPGQRHAVAGAAAAEHIVGAVLGAGEQVRG